ncbi:SDH family Clp fold serine proteinase [Pseudomarimonas arenosa]|uniref:SDH family Clp fold serine proteinase n=1 Tax=Pseudomarimonas arenosa TaxID=2774145 RepID=UPI002FC31D48
MFDIVWIVLLVMLLQPVVQRRLLMSARRRLRLQLERERGSRVILLVHRQETFSLFGLPLMRYIDIQDAEEVIHAIRNTPDEVPIDIVLHTPGGLALASLQIARALARHPAKVTALVPHYAMSGGTLIALAADQIEMCEHAALGPVDPQLGGYSAASVLRAVERQGDRSIDTDFLILADQAEMAIEQLRRSVVQLLGDRYRDDLAELIADELSRGQWTHDYPITLEEVERIGLHVGSAVPEAVLEMMRLYPQPARGLRSVEYSGRRPMAEPDADSEAERAPPRAREPADQQR